MKVLRSKWDLPPWVIEIGMTKLRSHAIQTDKLVMASQLDIVVVDKEKNKAIVINVAISSKSKIKKKEQEKYQGRREELKDVDMKCEPGTIV